MENNKRPQLNLRLDGNQALLDAVKAAADEQKISITAFVIKALKVAVGMEDEPVPLVVSNNKLDMLDLLDEKLDSELDSRLDEKLADESLLNLLADMVFEKLKKELA